MRRTALSLVSLLALASLPLWANADQDYGVLIISRERLEVPTNCEVGVYIDDQLAGRLFQEQALAFNLPPAASISASSCCPGKPPAACPACWSRPHSNSPSRPGKYVNTALPSENRACTSSPPSSNIERHITNSKKP